MSVNDTAKALNRIADQMKRSNDIEEQKQHDYKETIDYFRKLLENFVPYSTITKNGPGPLDDPTL